MNTTAQTLRTATIIIELSEGKNEAVGWYKEVVGETRTMCVCDDDCFYYHSWRNNVVVAFGTLLFFRT